MTPKEIVQKGYDCFSTGDMETFVGLFHEDVYSFYEWYAQIFWNT